MVKIKTHNDLEVFNLAFDSAMKIFEILKSFPIEERYSLTDQIRRSSRSVCANIAEAFRRRRYPKSFVSKLNEAEAESAETQTWIKFANKCNYIESVKNESLIKIYDNIIGKIVTMENQPENWSI